MFELTPNIDGKNSKPAKNAKSSKGGKQSKRDALVESGAITPAETATPATPAPEIVTFPQVLPIDSNTMRNNGLLDDAPLTIRHTAPPVESVIVSPVSTGPQVDPTSGNFILTPAQFAALTAKRAARPAKERIVRAPRAARPAKERIVRAPRAARPAFNLRGDIFNTPDGAPMTIRQVAEKAWCRMDGTPGIWNPAKIAICPVDAPSLVIQDSYHIVRDDYPAHDSRRFISTGRGVGEGYTLTKNEEIIQFCEAIANGRAQGCGSFFNGSIVYMAINLADDTTEIVDEGLENYLIVSTSHDGTRGYLASLCPMLPICWNTFNYSTDAAKTVWSLRHSEGITARLAMVSDILRQAQNGFLTVRDNLRKLASVKISQSTAKSMLEKLFPTKKQTTVDGIVKPTMIDEKRERILSLFNGGQDGATLASRRETLFGLTMAVSQDFERNLRTVDTVDVRTGQKRDENEVLADRILFKGESFRTELMNLAMSVADSN